MSSSITIDRTGTESVFVSCSCGWFYHEPKDQFGSFKSLRVDTAINRHERFGCLKNPLSHIEVIGGFTMVALYDPKTQKFESAACSCGWSFKSAIEELVERCEFHNMTHKNVLKVRKLYEDGEITYDGANCLLQSICSLDEARSLDFVDSWDGAKQYETR